jgi:co-chaperonin GroES (HSP10)
MLSAAVPAFLDAGAKATKWGTKAFKATKTGQKLVTKTAKVFNYATKATDAVTGTFCRLSKMRFGGILKSKVAWDVVSGAAISAASQKIITGEVNWRQVGKDAVVNAIAGKIGRAMSGQSDFIEGKCFTADTLIATNDGDKQIIDIEVGDEVYSANTETGEKGLKKVKQVFVRETNILAHVFVGDEEIRTTVTHPFWVEGKGWVDAGYLVSGDVLRTYNGELLEVKKVEFEYLDEFIKVYNFEVEDWHTYFVTGTEVLVHNANYGKQKAGAGNGGKVETPHKTVTGGKAPKRGDPNSIYEVKRADGSKSVTYYDDKCRSFSREDYGQLKPHGEMGIGPDGKVVPHEHLQNFSNMGPTDSYYRQLDPNGKPIGPWFED